MRKDKKTSNNDFLLVNRVRQELACRFKRGEIRTIVVSISGGADSVCVLHLLNDLKGEFDYDLEALHFNFSLRGNESKRDENFVRKICMDLNIPLKVKDFKKKGSQNTQLWARSERLRFYSSLMSKRKNIRIALGHNLDDQAETFFSRLLRGAGLKGLKGMAFESRGGIIRPLLKTGREEIRAFLNGRNIKNIEDSTNRSEIYLRNRIRHKLIPLMNSLSDHGDIRSSIANTMEIIAMEEEYLETILKKSSKAVLKSSKDGKISMDLQHIRNLPLVLKYRLIRAAIEKICGTLEGFNLSHIKNIERLARESAGSKRISLPGNIMASREYKKLYFESREDPTAKFEYSVEPPCTVRIDEIGSSLKMCILKKKGKKAADQMLFDYDKFKRNIKIRNFRDGDRILINTSEGPRKVKNIFIGKKIPVSQRRRIPFIMDGSNIAGIYGVVTDFRYRIGAKSGKILKVSLSKGI